MLGEKDGIDNKVQQADFATYTGGTDYQDTTSIKTMSRSALQS